jgi:hypothetical protein
MQQGRAMQRTGFQLLISSSYWVRTSLVGRTKHCHGRSKAICGRADGCLEIGKLRSARNHVPEVVKAFASIVAQLKSVSKANRLAHLSIHRPTRAQPPFFLKISWRVDEKIARPKLHFTSTPIRSLPIFVYMYLP